jgi:hypothetical protein
MAPSLGGIHSNVNRKLHLCRRHPNARQVGDGGIDLAGVQDAKHHRLGRRVLEALLKTLPELRAKVS